jgi:hypothetical protein
MTINSDRVSGPHHRPLCFKDFADDFVSGNLSASGFVLFNQN